MYFKTPLAVFISFISFAHASVICSVIPEKSNAKILNEIYKIDSSLNVAPVPMDVVHIEHSLPGQPNVIKAYQAYDQFKIMRDSALLWQKTKDNKYLFFSKKYLLAWIDAYRPSLNPIDETPFDSLIVTYQIIKSELDAGEKLKIDNFFNEWAHKYIKYIYAKRESEKGLVPNNWQSHRIKIITMLSTATGNKQLFLEAREIFKLQVLENIKSNGEVYDFTERDALSYAVFDLLPLTQAALVARSWGDNWYDFKSPSGSSLRKGVDWLVPYMDGDKTHEEFVNTKSEFDRVRRSIGMKDFKGNFKPQRAAPLFWVAASIDDKYSYIAEKLNPDPVPAIVICD
ncbi:alginate lyase family protein [Klebsiella sp. MISC125]|uniref:alginate lyase family protein n=1 Tax=Klebsiella sp. MISC125 TaxID=2755386 RepID=UPI003DA7BA39